MSCPVRVAFGAIVLLLALIPGSALAAGTDRLTPQSAPHRTSAPQHRVAAHAADPARHGAHRVSLPRQAAVVLVPGAGYGLRSGSSRVLALQHRLDRDGFAPGPFDGLYGPLTTEAVRRFQQAHGLAVDGLAGPRTFAALRRHVAAVLVPGTGYGLQSGSSRVLGLQHQLDREGFAPGPFDGLYGPLTTEAVRRFQQAHGLVVDGLAGPRTFAALRAGLVRATRRIRQPGPARSRARWTQPARRLAVLSSPPPPLLVEAQRLAIPDLPMTPVLLALALLGLLTSVRSYRVVRRRAGHADHGGRTR